MPRVLHIYKDYYPPVLGGIERHINLLCQRMKDEFEPRVDIGLNDYPVRVWMSSVDGRGVGLLVEAIKQITVSELSEVEICLLPHAGQIRAALYQSNAILSEAIDEYGNSHLKLRISHMDLERIFA